jgi:O-antigen/teichoic acid export membrane protein
MVALVGLPIMTWVALFAQIGRSFGWPGIAYAPSQILHPLLLVAFVWVAAGAHELEAATIIGASLGVFLVILLLQLAFFAMRLSGRLRATRPRYETAVWLAVALPLVLFDGFGALIAQLDLVFLGVWMPPHEVGAYAAAARIALLVNFCFDAAVSLAGPRLAALHAHGGTSELRRLVGGLLPWTAIPALGVFALLIVLGDTLLGLFGSGFEVARPALVVLAAGHLASVLAGPVGVLLNMTGHHVQCARTLAGAALLNAVLNVALIPRWGLLGAATATAVAILLSRLRLLRLVRTRLALEPSVWGLIRAAASRSD